MTVKSPVGWYSIDSSASRSASVAGHAPEPAVTGAAAGSFDQAGGVGDGDLGQAVELADSDRSPATCVADRDQPTVADEKTKIASEAPGVASVAPPVPAVWMT